MFSLSRVEKILLPSFLFIFEVIFLVLYGLLVEYDGRGSPDHDLEEARKSAEASDYEGVIRNLRSSLGTIKIYPFFQDIHVMVFIGFGFLMTFLRRYGFSSIAFNMLVAAFAIQWSTITSGVFTFIDQAPTGNCCTISVNLESMVGSDFAGAAALITMGAVLGRASPFQLIIITFFELMFYSANEAINLHVYHAADVGGSMVIHTFGAYFGLAVSFVLYRKNAKDHPTNSSRYDSDLFAMIGTIFLWLFWPSFNGALASGNSQYRVLVNTYYSLSASVLGTFIFSMLLDKKQRLSMTHIQNATLAGGVAIGSVADMVIQPWGAILIGLLSGMISVLGYKLISPLLEKLRLQDTCGVHNLHGMPGVFSGVASAIAAGVADFSGGNGKVRYGNSLFLVFPERAPSNASELTADEKLLGVEPGSDRHAGMQAGYQLALLVTTLAVSIVGGLLTGLIVNYIPIFDSVHKKSDLFDDKGNWELPDEADAHLPQDGHCDKEEKEGGSGKMELEVSTAADSSGVRQRSSPLVETEAHSADYGATSQETGK